jgi:D-alanine-D-alanine ligase
MDKVAAKAMAGAASLPQPRHVGLRADQVGARTPDELADRLGLPMFVKPANMGSSIGVSKAKTVADVRTAVDLALAYDEWIVAEEAIVGREIEVAVLGDLEPRASLPGEIVPGSEFYDYADKYLDEGSQAIIPAALDPAQVAAVQALAVRAFSTLRCSGLARVDFFLEEGGRGFLLNEVNTMPGFTPISMYPKLWVASGLSYPALIDELVSLALARHARQRRNTSR